MALQRLTLRRPERPPLVLIFAITLTGILANTLINAPLPDIIAELGVEPSGAGLVVAGASIPGIVMAPVIGLLADRFGRRQVLVPCLVIFGIAGLAVAVAPTYGLLVAARLAQGVGSAGLINLAVVVLSDFWDGPDRVRVIGWNAAVLTVSVAVLPAVGGLLAEGFGWRWALAPYGLALVTAVAVFLLVPDVTLGAPLGLGDQLRRAGAVLRQPRVAGSVLYGGAVFVLIFGLFLTALPLLLESRFGLSAGARGLVLSAPAIGSTIAALSLGRMRRRFGARRLVLVATGLFTVAFAVIGVTPVLWILPVAAVIYGLGEGSTIPTIQEVVASSSPTESRGAVVAVWVGSARAGQSVGPLLVGAALAVTQPGMVFVIGAGLAAALGVVQLVVRPVRAGR